MKGEVEGDLVELVELEKIEGDVVDFVDLRT
jgi:hypothetical protein